MFKILLALLCMMPSYFAYVDESNLHTALFSGLDTTIRPMTNTTVSLTMGLMSIAELDIVSQEFTISGFLIASWSDSRLTWTPASYGGIEGTKIFFSKVWAPALLISNSAEGIKVINDNSDIESTSLYVDFTGTVHWLAPVDAKVQCSVDIKSYPFDSQSCDIIVSSWMFSTDELYFYTTASNVNRDLYTVNGEWSITSTSTSNVTRTLHGFPMSSVKFTINLYRKYAYYVINMLLPVTVLTVLGPFVFLLPIESGEQNGYSLTIMLSLSVVMATVAESIPPTANSISILSVYLLTTYILCAMETLLVVLMTRMHSYTGKGYKLSARVNRAAQVMANLTYYRRSDDEDDHKQTESNACLVEADKNLRMGGTPVAWKAEKGKPADENSINQSDQGEIIYSYEEFVHIFNSVNFVVSLILTGIVIIIFMALLNAP